MLDRPPADRDAKRRKRELHKLAERRRREREHNGERVYLVCAGKIVHEALVARSIDGGLSDEAAEREACDRTKVSDDLADIALQWAKQYLAERHKRA